MSDNNTDISTAPLSPAETTITTTNDQAARDIESWRRIFLNTSVGVCVAIPIIVLLPPRKLDLYTFGLGVTWFMSAGFVSEQKTGQGLLWHVGNHIPSVRNRERMEGLKREEEEQRRARRQEDGAVQEEVRKRGLLKGIWMGGESDDWVEERKRKEKEALEEGRGYGGLIMDQIKDVWGVKKEEDDDEVEDAARKVGVGMEKKEP